MARALRLSSIRTTGDLASFYTLQGQYSAAEPLYQRAVAIREKTLGPEHPEMTVSLESYAALLRKMKDNAKAVQIEARARAIRAKQTRENPVQ